MRTSRLALTAVMLFIGVVLMNARPAAAGNFPAWCKPGLRLIFFEGSAEVAKVRIRLVPDPDGNYTLNGRKCHAEEVIGSAGGGFTVFDYGSVDDKSVSVLQSTYGLADAQNKVVTLIEARPPFGGIGDHLAESTYWQEPAKLAALKDGTVSGVTVLRMKYPLAGHEFNAIRIVTPTDTGGTVQTYDLDTGLCLFSSMSSIRIGMDGAYATDMAITRLEAVRQVNLPWKDMAAPAWVGQTKELVYEATQSIVIGGDAGPSFSANMVMTVDKAGPNYVGYSVTVPNSGMPPAPMAHGSAMRQGLFLPPDIIPQLKEGQVLDADKVLNIKLFVSRVDDQGVTITEGNSLYQCDMTYDHDGLLRQSVITINQSPAVTTHTLKLVKKS